MRRQAGPIRVMHVGLGPIGAASSGRSRSARASASSARRTSIRPRRAGTSARLPGVGRSLRVKVSADVQKAIKAAKPDVVVLCTSSSLKQVVPQMEEILKLRVPIVSTTEELAYPTRANLKYARAIHHWRRRAKVAVLGTGVNPGFAMDALPIMLTGVCERVQALHVDRVQDARIRRLPFQQKIGAGLTPRTVPEEGRRRQRAPRRAGGIDLDDCRCAGMEARRITDEIQPKIATETVASEFLAVDPGFVCGIVQDGVGYREGVPVITLHMEAYLGAPESYRRRRDHRLAGAEDED